MKTGERLIIGLLGCMWSGVRSPADCCMDCVHITTLYEDHAHGANMQATALLQNLCRAASVSNSLPERLTISADNTVKETKNNTVLCFMIWLLCYSAQTPLWCIRTVYKMVGHTHDNLDRFFSRVGIALRGHSYVSKSDMQDLISEGLSSYTISWAHASQSFDFENIRHSIGINMKRMRNIHDLELFRDAAGIYVRWKQWMTDETWSHPKLVAPAAEIETIASLRPPGIPHHFQPAKANSGLALVSRLESELQATGMLTSRVKASIQELRSVWSGQSDQNEFPLSDLLDSLACTPKDNPIQLAVLPAAVPSDVLYQSCPGHDLVGAPVETLVELSCQGVPVSSERRHSECIPGDLLIARVQTSSKLPFFLGVLRDVSSGRDGLVEWMHPQKSTECKFSSGKKNKS
jgi:hypothetical protein